MAAGLVAVSNPHAALARIQTVLDEVVGEAAATTAVAEPEVLTAKKEDAPAAGVGDKDKKADKKADKK